MLCLLRLLFAYFLIGLKYIFNILHYDRKILVLAFTGIKVAYLFIGGQITIFLFYEANQITPFGRTCEVAGIIVSSILHLLAAVVEETCFFLLRSIVVIPFLVPCWKFTTLPRDIPGWAKHELIMGLFTDAKHKNPFSTILLFILYILHLV